jgi:hypothetical protein
MYLVKGSSGWRSLDQWTRNAPDLPQWISLSQLPLKQLTTGRRAAPRVFYLPQHMPAGRRLVSSLAA